MRYHLGILLLWMGDVPNSRKQLQQTLKLGQKTDAVVDSATAVLAELAKIK